MKKALAVLVCAVALSMQQIPASASSRIAVVVRLEPSGSVRELVAHAGRFPVRARWHVVNALAATMTSEQIALLSRDPSVRAIEPDRTYRISASTARASYGVTKAAADFGVTGDRDGALKTFTTRDVVACVVDTGIDSSHVDLDQGQVIAWKDFVNGRTRPYDDNGHGTHVASIIAGQGDGTAAYRGVAPGTALVGVKVMSSSGTGSTSTIISGVQFCIDHKATDNIRIMNLSLGGPGPSSGTDTLSAAVNAAADHGILPVVAAGNDGPARATIGSPAAAAKALTVCSISDPGVKGFSVSPWSSRGPTADGRMKPDVCAPGQSITAARANSGSGYITYSGTSMAAPFVAGVASLMLDANNTLTPAQLKSIMMTTAQDWTVPGADTETGAGRLQAYEAIKRAGSFTGTGPVVPAHFMDGGSLGGTGSLDRWSLSVTSVSYPIAITLIIPGASSSKDFDLVLRAPGGSIVATSDGSTRQETIGLTPTSTGTYTVSVESYTGSGSYDIDFSYRGSAAALTHDG
ncbi:MAG: S8 family serine peptidase [Actinomycetota bacterium]